MCCVLEIHVDPPFALTRGLNSDPIDQEFRKCVTWFHLWQCQLTGCYISSSPLFFFQMEWMSYSLCWKLVLVFSWTWEQVYCVLFIVRWSHCSYCPATTLHRFSTYHQGRRGQEIATWFVTPIQTSMQHVPEWSGGCKYHVSQVLWCLKYSRIMHTSACCFQVFWLLIRLSWSILKTTAKVTEVLHAVAAEFLFKNRLVTRCQVLHFAVMEAARLQDGNLACNCRKFLGSKLESSENLSTFRTFLGICFSKVSIHRYPGIHFNFLSIYISLQLFAHGKGSEVLTLICAIRSTQKFAANTPELFLHMSITSCFRRLCQTSAGSKSRCVQQSFVYNSQDAWIKDFKISRWVKCLVLRSLVAHRIDHIHLSPKEWSASAKFGDQWPVTSS